jgi:hypothetical protein
MRFLSTGDRAWIYEIVIWQLIIILLAYDNICRYLAQAYAIVFASWLVDVEDIDNYYENYLDGFEMSYFSTCNSNPGKTSSPESLVCICTTCTGCCER